MAEQGISVSVAVDDSGFRHALERLRARAGHLQPAFADIAGRLLLATQQRFERQRGPDGSAWKPLSARTLAQRARKRQSGPILRISGDLYRSYTQRADDDSAEVGSNWPYARIHQLGGKAGRGRKVFILARPVLGLDSADSRAIVRIIRQYLEDGI